MKKYNNDEHYQECQQKFLETGDIKYMWDAYPDILHAIRVCMYKKIKKMTPDFDDRAKDAAIYFIDIMSRKKRPIKRLMGYASFLAMRALYNKNSVLNDTTLSLDDLYEEVASYTPDFLEGVEE